MQGIIKTNGIPSNIANERNSVESIGTLCHKYVLQYTEQTTIYISRPAQDKIVQ